MTLKESLGKWTSVLDSKEVREVLHQLNVLYRTKAVLPAPENVFRTFELCPYDSCKVIMIGMDPYPQKDVATGLLFGNKPDTKEVSPSLKVIRSACDCEDFDITLESWAKQGILLLNSALTVEQDKVGSHTLLWRPLMTSFLQKYSNTDPGQVFVLFGDQAKSLKPYINPRWNYVIESLHPAYYARTNTPMPKDVFREVNNILVNKYGIPINWGRVDG